MNKVKKRKKFNFDILFKQDLIFFKIQAYIDNNIRFCKLVYNINLKNFNKIKF